MEKDKVLCFSDVVFKNGDWILADTSFILGFVGFSGSYQQKQASILTTNASINNSTILVTAPVEREVLEVITHSKFDDKGLPREEDKKWYRESHRDKHQALLEDVQDTFNNYWRTLRNLGCFAVGLDGKTCTGDELIASMIQNGMHGVTDCEIILTAQEYEAPYIATMDSDFLNNNTADVKVLIDKNAYERWLNNK